MHTFAILNNINPASMLMLGLIGLLLFGKDLPLIARNVVKEYLRFRKMINEATGDIQREMEFAASHIEAEKRKIESELHAASSSMTDIKKDVTHDSHSAYGIGDEPYKDPSAYAPSLPILKPAADPKALDINTPSVLSHRATDAVKSSAAQVAALDTLQKGVPAPSKIPPPI